MSIRIPVHELKITFARSSGAGGQNVNKTSTKTILHWPFLQSQVLSQEEKDKVRIKLANRINNAGELVIIAEEERSQAQNRAKAVARLQSLLTMALKAPKKRRATSPTKASKLRRVEEKKRRSEIKSGRRMIEE